MRLGHYMVGHHDALWALLCSDDGKLTGRTDYPERGLLMYLLTLILFKLPIAWKKLRGVQRPSGSGTCWTSSASKSE